MDALLQKKRRGNRLHAGLVCLIMLLALCLPGTALAATLRSGAEGEAVAALQARLSELGYYAQPVSGQYDPATKTAVKLFQKANGLSASGTAYDSTQQKMMKADCVTYARYVATVKLSRGDEGEAVVMLQKQLAALGYYTKEINGKFDSSVRSAVKEFQTANSLKSDP